MKTLIIVILSIIGYLAMGFGSLVFFAKKHAIDNVDTFVLMLLWPMAYLVIALEKGLVKVLDKVSALARALSEKLPK